jgi:hypothetical protein
MFQYHDVSDGYKGRIPLELYIELRNKFPQFDGESDVAWLQRVKRDPLLVKKMFGTPQFKDELLQAVTRRMMAQSGATRVGHTVGGPALVPLTKPGAANAKKEIAEEYQKDFMVGPPGSRQYKYAKEAYQLLLDQFDAATPVNGSIFWNGINELTLAEMVHDWNRDLGSGQLFGQLEATTAARYVNKQFVWEKDPKGLFHNYFDKVSGKLGHMAKGHVTAVVRCGLRNDSIFTVTELPAMLKNMDEAIRAKKEPGVTDISIVVIEPKHMLDEQIAVFTNNDIAKVPIIETVNWPVRGPKDVKISTTQRFPAISQFLRYYWAARGPRPESAATKRIRKDFARLIVWGK